MRAMNDSTFDSIVSDFFRAATGAIDWNCALERVQVAFGARAALLHTLDFATGRLLSLRGGGPHLEDAVLTYVREYHVIDPRRQHQMRLGAEGLGKWQHDHETFGPAYVAHDRFFQHYLPAYDSRYCANVTIPIAGTVATGFVLELPAARGPLDADEREVARRLGEHMREALHAFERVRALMSQALAGHGLLSAFPYPMWLLDEDRYIVFSNPAAEREVESGVRAARRGDQLALIRSRSDRELTERLSALCRASHGTNTVIDLRANAAEPPTWLHLSLLVPEVVMGAFGASPQVLATLFDPRHVSALDPFALTQMFNLTPTEAKVAARLADGLNAQQIGEAHGTAEATVRTQVRQVLHKMGTQRVVDVVRVLRQGEVLWAKAAGTLG